jgi:hypothetical protein
MRAADIPIDQEGALGLCRLLLRAAESAESKLRPQASDKRPARTTLLERLDRWLARARQREVERYLAQSHDVFELETRIRELERLPYY